MLCCSYFVCCEDALATYALLTPCVASASIAIRLRVICLEVYDDGDSEDAADNDDDVDNDAGDGSSDVDGVVIRACCTQRV